MTYPLDSGTVILAIVGLIAGAAVLWRLKKVPGTTWASVMIRAPLPMLAAASSYGVYSFSVIFMPTWMALISSMAFELVYISLSYTLLTSKQMKDDARRVAVGAVGVAILYNILAGYLHLRPVDWASIPDGWIFLLAIVHGAPLATVAYLYSQLMFHHNNDERVVDAVVSTVQAPVKGALPAPGDMRDRILEMKDQGMSPKAVADVLGAPWTAQKVRKVIRNDTRP